MAADRTLAAAAAVVLILAAAEAGEATGLGGPPSAAAMAAGTQSPPPPPFSSRQRLRRRHAMTLPRLRRRRRWRREPSIGASAPAASESGVESGRRDRAWSFLGLGTDLKVCPQILDILDPLQNLANSLTLLPPSVKVVYGCSLWILVQLLFGLLGI